jgi:hypothetical protein
MMTPDGKPPLPLGCPSGITVRQGNTIFVGAPGMGLSDLTVETMTGDVVTAAATLDPHGKVAVSIHAPHGATPGGSLDPSGNISRIIKITEPTTRGPWVREIPVFISFITAAPGGSNDNQGVLDDPFETLQRAVEVAAAGDTIALRNPPPPAHDGGANDGAANDGGDGGDDGGVAAAPAPMSGPGPGSDPTPIMMVPPGITIAGVDSDKVTLAMALGLQGDTVLTNLFLNGSLDIQGAATLKNVILNGPRLVLTHPAAHVTFDRVGVAQGITIDKKASTAAGAPPTELDIGDFSKIASLSSTDGPLLVQADGASVSIAGSNTSLSNVTANLDTILFEGKGQKLSISNAAAITNIPGLLAVHVRGTATVAVSTGVRFINPVTIEGGASDATFDNNVNFGSAPLTFQGHDLSMSNNTVLTDSLLTFGGHQLSLADTWIVGKGIAVNGVANFNGVTVMGNAPVTFTGTDLTILGGTNFTDSPLTFNGTGTLDISQSSFFNQGIVQAGGMGKLDTVQIFNYSTFGYQLLGGNVQISNSKFACDPNASVNGTGPFALQIDAQGGAACSATSQGTTYDNAPFTPQPCQFTTTSSQSDGTVYSISGVASVDFCGD